MKKNILFLLLAGLFLLNTNSLIAQHRTCGTEAHLQEKLKDPAFAKEYKKRRTEMLVSASQRAVMPCTSPLIVPIAVHYQANNIPNQCMIDAAVAQIDQMNLDFRSCNVNAGDLCSWIDAGCTNFGGTAGADAMPVDGACIQFCLADQNLPNGEDNIGGYAITAGDYGSNNASNVWTGYLNVYVNGAGGALGFVPYLSGGNNTNTTDGATVLTSTFGATGFSGCNGVGTDNTFSGGATLTHEVGHWFGLEHTFSDNVADTPPQNNSNGGCPTVNTNTCTSSVGSDYSGNFMDYVDDDCMHNFSADQVDIMISTAAAQNQWNTNSMSCYADWQNGTNTYTSCTSGPCGNTSPPTASFTSNPSSVSICPGATASFSFTDTSSDNPTSWAWTFSGAGVSPTSSTAQNPTVTASAGGTLTATLVASNANGASSPAASNTVSVTVLPASDPTCSAPVASFTANPTSASICPGGATSISFTDSSTGSPTSWAWTFSGVGVSPTSSTAQNPSVTVNSAGTLTATLVVSNTVNSSSPNSQSVNITVLPASDPTCAATPCLDFVGGPYGLGGISPSCGNGCTPLTAGFEAFANEAYLLAGLTAGEQYTLDICDGYDPAVWSAVLTIAEIDAPNLAAVPGSEISWASGCSVSFTAPYSGDFIAIVSEDGACGGAEIATDNGIPSLVCNGLQSTSVFTDAGGFSYNYFNNTNETYTFCPSNAGGAVTVTFNTFAVEGDSDGNAATDCYDIFNVYDGNSNAAPQIGGEFCDNPGPGSPGTVTSTAADGCLTFELITDGSVTLGGWDATVDCGTVTSACPADYNVSGMESGSGGQDGDGDFETDGPIVSTQMITSGFVDYDSATDITMNGGFEVVIGAVFCAFIDGCDGSGGVVNPIIGNDNADMRKSTSNNEKQKYLVGKQGNERK